MDAVNHELITAGSTTDTAINITDGPGSGYVTYFPKVVTGTVKFGINSVHANAHGYTSSDVIPPCTCPAGTFRFKAAANTDTFVVTTA
jgi:hypothetical protein